MIVILALLTPRSFSHFSLMPSCSFTVKPGDMVPAELRFIVYYFVPLFQFDHLGSYGVIGFLSGWVALESSVGVTGYVEIYFRRIMHKSCHQPSATGDFQRTVLIVVLWYPKTSTRQLQAIIQRIPTCSQLSDTQPCAHGWIV